MVTVGGEGAGGWRDAGPREDVEGLCDARHDLGCQQQFPRRKSDAWGTLLSHGKERLCRLGCRGGLDLLNQSPSRSSRQMLSKNKWLRNYWRGGVPVSS